MNRAIIFACMISTSASAGYLDDKIPKNIFGSGTIKFGIDGAPSDSCDYHGRYFKFDATTAAGKNILSILLAAKMAGKGVNIWYTPSSTPGTNVTNGCSVNSLATVTEIGIK